MEDEEDADPRGGGGESDDGAEGLDADSGILVMSEEGLAGDDAVRPLQRATVQPWLIMGDGTPSMLLWVLWQCGTAVALSQCRHCQAAGRLA